MNDAAEPNLEHSSGREPRDTPLAAWPRRSLSQRLVWAACFRGLIARHADQLCDTMREEIAKPRHEALLSDVLPLLSAIKWMEKRAPAILAPRAIAGTPWWLRGMRARVRREPLGHVAIIATWNYPVHLLGVQLVQALIAGNEVTVKPSERASRTQALLLDLAEQAGLPEGVLDRVGASREAGRDMLALNRFDHVVFTGSTRVGIEVAKTLAKSLTPATLELSGRDSAFVLKDADAKKAARAIYACMSFNAGQTCMGPRRALVHESVYNEFASEIERLAAKAASRELIDEDAARDAFELCKKAVEAGGKEATGTLSEPVGRLWRATAILDCPADAELVEGRHFGPALAVVRVPTLTKALEIHHACDQHLSTSIFTRDAAKAAKTLAPLVGAGLVTINDCVIPSAHPAVSITGNGQSGMGISQGEEGLLAMTRPLQITFGPGSARRAIKPPPKIVLNALARFTRWWYSRGTNMGTNKLTKSGASSGGKGVHKNNGDAVAQRHAITAPLAPARAGQSEPARTRPLIDLVGEKQD
jgi:aldehyde dehydrogenase (NAD+)